MLMARPWEGAESSWKEHHKSVGDGEEDGDEDVAFGRSHSRRVNYMP
jgi:hypothetical protein